MARGASRVRYNTRYDTIKYLHQIGKHEDATKMEKWMENWMEWWVRDRE